MPPKNFDQLRYIVISQEATSSLNSAYVSFIFMSCFPNPHNPSAPHISIPYTRIYIYTDHMRMQFNSLYTNRSATEALTNKKVNEVIFRSLHSIGDVEI